LYDFIETYDFGLELSCQKVINFFEREYDEEKSRTGGLKFFNKKRQKICATKTLSFDEDVEINELVYFFVSQGIDKYSNDYTFLNVNKSWRLSPSYNIQRYDGDKEGYFSIHNEASGSYPYRMLAWMVYLNDASSGTEFPYQNITIQARTGRTVIWPAAWTHPHRGVIPNVGVKYIATGWFYYLPNGNPKFDGHHPDENIQEIVV
jgi:prolyl 4-hydroxylase